LMYQHGQGVEVDLDEAMRLYELAAEFEHEDAIAALEELKSSRTD